MSNNFKRPRAPFAGRALHNISPSPSLRQHFSINSEDSLSRRDISSARHRGHIRSQQVYLM